MGIKVLIEEAREVANSVWFAQLAPHEVKLMGIPRMTQGRRSVVLVEGANFNDGHGILKIDASTVRVGNLRLRHL